MGANPAYARGFATMTGTDLVPVSPDDDNDLATEARAIRCRGDGAAGTLRITTTADAVRNTYIAAGEVLTVGVVRVHNTGTTATGLEVLL